MESRKKQEAEFHDHLRDEAPFQRYSTLAEERMRGDKRWSNFKFYSIERKSRAYVDEWIRSRSFNRRLLDYGCGNGDDTIFAAKFGACAIGVDISEVSIAHCRRKAHSEGVSERTDFYVADAEALPFADNSFDLVVEYGVLHHLDFDAAMAEICRVLKPGGQAICTEALAQNPLIHAYRRLTPHLRTSWEVEHIMRRGTLLKAKHWFRNVEMRFFHLATLAAVPFRTTSWFNPLLTLFEAVDGVLLSLPGLRWQAWQIVFELSGPCKNSNEPRR